MKPTMLGTAAAALLGMVMFGGAAVAADPVTLKLGYSLPATSHYGVGAQAFADALAEKTDGRFKVEMFPSNALGGEREMIEGAQFGTIDLVVTSTGPVGNFVPETLVFDIPFLFRDYAHARGVLDGEIGQSVLDKFPERGLIALAWAENGFRHLTNSKQAVTEPEDVKGLKIRTMQNDVHMRAFTTLGALPTPMAFPEVFTALQQHTIDGQENPIPVIVSGNFAQVQKYLSLTGHVYSPALFIMAPSRWEELSDEDKAAFKAAAKIGANAMRKQVETFEADGIAKLEAAGMTVVEHPDKARFLEELKPAYAEYEKRFDPELIKRISDWKQ